MTWTCRIMRHPDAETPWERDEHGFDVPPQSRVIYRGMFRVYTFLPHEQVKDVGGAPVTVVRTTCYLPAVERLPFLASRSKVQVDLEAVPFREGDVIVREQDGKDIGYYRVASPHDITHSSAQKLLVDEGGPKLLEGGVLDDGN